MTEFPVPQQTPSKAPQTPAIPALPGEPGAATGSATGAQGAAQRAADAAQRAADIARIEQQRVDEVIRQGDAVLAPPPPPGTFVSTGFPVNPAEIIREAIPIFGISLAMMITLFVGWPLARAFARRSDKRMESGMATANQLQPQIRQLQESLDLMAVELERISEAQRFQAKLLSERSSAEQKRG